jgi:hypothetical protein
VKKVYWLAFLAVGLLAQVTPAQQPIPPAADGPAPRSTSGPVAPPLIDGPKEVDIWGTFRVANLPPEAGVDWTFPDGLKVEEAACEIDPATGKAKPYEAAMRVGGPPGKYTAKARLLYVDAKTKRPRITALPNFTFTIKGATPTPVPPGPQPVPPGPTPPGPAPEPGAESPFKEPGLRALYLYESDDLYSYPPVRYSALYDGDARDYLNAKCVPGADGETKEWRKWDKDVDTTKESKVWQDAVARARVKYKEWEAKEQKETTEWNIAHADPKDQKKARSGLPWLMVGDGKTGWEGPALDPDQALERLRAIGK